MRELRSCDFCGGDAAGTFEVVPDELAPSETEQRRVVLCPHCLDTLETVLEPFLARLSGDESAGASAIDSEMGPSAGSEDADDADATSDEQPTRTAAVDGDARAEGIAIGRSGGAVDDDDGTDPGDGDAATAETDPLDADGVVVNGDSDGEDVDADDADGSKSLSVEDEPDQFRKVMRLLSNREFPVERAEFAELTAGAYEMEDDHVARIIDHAVDRGVLVDDGGTLKKP